ncbi:hypothetical protein V8E55_004411 [Tylopilus felleus]
MRSYSVVPAAFVAAAVAPVMSAPVATKAARDTPLDINYSDVLAPLSPAQASTLSTLSSMLEGAMHGTEPYKRLLGAPAFAASTPHPFFAAEILLVLLFKALERKLKLTMGEPPVDQHIVDN